MKEIEHKFLVSGSGWKKASGTKSDIRQGYLANGRATVRVRLRDNDAFLTVKSEGLLTRNEFEYQIPLADAKAMLKLCRNVVRKTRYLVKDEAGQLWEVDVFKDELKGLVLAELELASEKVKVIKPAWLGPEVTENSDYANSSLASLKNGAAERFVKAACRKAKAFRKQIRPSR